MYRATILPMKQKPPSCVVGDLTVFDFFYFVLDFKEYAQNDDFSDQVFLEQRHFDPCHMV